MRIASIAFLIALTPLTWAATATHAAERAAKPGCGEGSPSSAGGPREPLNAAQAYAGALAVSDATADDATVAALQVDFDARQSQREWYAGVLRRVPERRPRIRVPLNPVFHCT